MTKVLLITGGGRGIGAAIARKAATDGYRVAINYRDDRDRAEALVAEIEKAGGRAISIAADVSSEDEVKRLFARTVAALCPLTHVVNNAGITGRSSRLDEATAETIATTIAVNLTGAVLVAREAVRHLSPRHGGKGGAIVNISSAAATLGSPGEYVWYAASKGGIDSLTIGLARELAEEKIRVNAVTPGMVETEIHDRSTGDPARVERIRPLIPMKRVGTPDEVADAVLYLLSDGASYITGANLHVSGGR
ncbi:MAG: glucose 1-dehydrogenase [Alphaproteobacteria bacterium]|nr:glucose 1-dehydrogenase [Alphaproteobacteria bacterium]